LEGRDCPSAPQISLAATVLTGRNVLLTGTVLDDNPDSVKVTFSGVVTGSAIASKAGTFSFTAQASGLGTIKAAGVDDQGLTSNVALASVTSDTPVISLTETSNGGNSVTLSGHVTAPNPSGLPIVIGGGAGGSTTTDANGNFNITLNANIAAAITAYATDAWSETSNLASATSGTPTAALIPPSITNFSVTQEGNSFTFSGQLNTPMLPGSTVQLGGLPSLNTTSPITVGANGWFSITITLQPGEDGTATVVGTDGNGNTSGVASCIVR
jgi:hypothetical protein